MPFKEKCRCCLNCKGPMLSFYDENTEVIAAGQMTIVDLLKMFTQISIARNDGFPEQICTTCLDAILRIYTFKLNCESSIDTIKQLQNSFHETDNLDEFCRTCVQTGQKMHPLKEGNLQLLKAFTRKPITDNDGMSRKICSNCLEALKIACEFKYKCENSQVELLEQLSEVQKNSTKSPVKRFKNDFAELSEAEIKKQCEKEDMLRKRSLLGDVIEIDDEDDCEGNGGYNYDEEDEEQEEIPNLDTPSRVEKPPTSNRKFINVEDIVEAEINPEAFGQMFEINNLLETQMKSEGTVNDVIEITDSEGESESGYMHEEPECYLSEHSVDYPRLNPRVVHDHSYQCPACYQVFHPQHFFYHFLALHIEGNFCKFCNQEFQGSERQHVSFHRPLLYACSECNMCFDTQLELARHLKNDHQRDSSFKCNGCGEMFSKRAHRDTHEVLHQKGLLPIDPPKNDNMNGRRCPICFKIFKRRNYTLSHMMIHTGLKLYKCELCQRDFPRKSSLRLHFIQIHTDLRPYKCKSCPLSFKRRDALVNHTKRFHGKFGPPRTFHPGLRPYQCNVCNKTYVTPEYLKAHKKTHNAIRPYACEMCPARFRTSSMLRKHVVVHSPDRPFVCAFCQASFKLKGHLSSHLFYVHDRKFNEVDSKEMTTA